jgi:uncharacterized protein
MSRKRKKQNRPAPARKRKSTGKSKGKSKRTSTSKSKSKSVPPRVSRIEARPDMIRVRRSRLHGRGVFALRRIRKGTRVVEYLGDRVSHDEADNRYSHKPVEDNHTFLFIVNRSTVIDGGANGNDARYINHSCDPNCESLIEDRRVFIEAIRTVQPGDELTYDYQIGRDKEDPANVDEIYACRCGAKDCRGSMLWPPKRKSRPRVK